MNYCDLHCDTPLELYERCLSLRDGDLNVNMEKFSAYGAYVQLAAYCVPQTDSDSVGYEKYFKVRECFLRETEKCSSMVCTDKRSIVQCVDGGVPAFVLTVEDARILEGNISRLETLFQSGVRVLTPLWGGESCIGGSHESPAGLTPFGRDVMRACGELGVITDISHASHRSADEILDIASRYGMPVIASHSCSAAVNPHSRNLSDGHLREIVRSGGLVGVNLYPPHLTGNLSNTDDVIRHLSHYVAVAGENHVALGCDFDGMGLFTEGCEDATCIPHLAGTMKAHGYTDSLIDKITFTNAYTFLRRHVADG